MKKRWLRRLAILVATAIALAILAFFLLQTPQFTRFELIKLDNYLQSQYGVGIQADNIRLDPAHGSVTLQDVVIRSTESPDLPALLRARRIYLRIGILQLIRGFTDIEDVQVDSPQIHYAAEKNGRNNLPKPKETSSAASKFLIALAQVTNGSFEIEDRESNLTGVFPGLQMRVEGNHVTLAHHFVFRGPGANLRYQGKAIPIGPLEFSGTYLQPPQSNLKIDLAQLAAADSQLSVSGSLNDLSRPVADLFLKPNLNLARISALVGLTPQVNGRVSGTVNIKGPLNNLLAAVNLQGLGIAVSRSEPMDLVAGSSLQFENHTGRLRINSFSINSRAGSLDAKADLSLRGESGSNSVEASIKNLDLIPVSRQFNRNVQIASLASGSVSARWRGNFVLPQVSGTARILLVSSRHFSRRNALPLSAELNATFGDNRIMAKLVSAEALGAKVSGDISVRSLETIQANLLGSIPDLDAASAQISSFFGRQDRSLIGTKASGSLSFRANAGGRISQPHVTVSADAPNLQVGTLAGINVKTNAELSGKRVNFTSSTVLPQNQTVLAQGDVDLSRKVPAVNVDARAEKLSLKALVSMVGSSIPASGDLGISMHLAGPLDRLSGQGSLTASHLMLYQEPLGNLNADLRLSTKEIQTTRFLLLKDPQNPSSGTLEMKGSYNLDSGRYTLQADGRNLRFNQLVLPGGTPVHTTAALSASGAGTLAHPSVDLQLNAVDTQVGDRVLGTITASATLRDQSLSAETRLSKFGLIATGHAVTRTPYPADIKIQVNRSDLSLLGIRGSDGQALTGSVDGSLKGSGNLSTLEKTAQASAQLDTLLLRFGNQEIHNTGPLEAEYRQGTLNVHSAKIVSGNSSLQVAGTLPLIQGAPAGRANVRAQLDLGQAVQLAGMPEGYAASGSIDLDFTVFGTVQRIDGSGNLKMADGSFRVPQFATPISNVSIDAGLENGALVLRRANADWASAKIGLSGVFPLGLLPNRLPVQFRRSEGPARLALNLTNLKLESMGKLPQGATGTISLHATGQAAGTDLRSITAQVAFDQLSLNVNQFSLNQDGASTILLRDGVVSINRFVLEGPASKFQATGTAGLFGDGPLSLRLNGNIDAAVLGIFAQDVKTAGNVQLQLALGGTRKAPDFSGSAQADNVQAAMSNPKIAATDVNAKLNFGRDQVAIQSFTGNLNGGSLTAGGSVSYAKGTLSNVDLKLDLKNVYLDYPEGLKSVVTGNVTAQSSDESIVIGGEIHIPESSYRQPLDFGGEVLSYLRATQVSEAGPQRSLLLSRIRYNLPLHTDSPLMVDNNIAKVAATANLKLVGTYYQPSVVGKLSLDEGGQIFLNERTYVINRGEVNLTSESHIEPDLNIEAETKATGYDITLQLTGTPQKMTTSLTSEPPLAEPDIVSVLLTGKTREQMQGNEMQLAQTQALSLIGGQAGQEIASRAQRTSGLSNFRIDPTLISSESDPGARLTVGQDIRKDLSLAYSMNLVNGGDQIWVGQYNLSRRFTTQVTKQQDNSYRLEFRHDLRFGGAPTQEKEAHILPKKKIGSLTFQGEPLLSDKAVESKLKLKEGDKYDFFKVQKGLDRLHNFYSSQHRLENQIRLSRKNQDNTVDLTFDINAGPPVEFEFNGTSVSGSTRKKVTEAWRNGIFDIQRLDDSVAAIRRPLLEKGYLQSDVGHSVTNNSAGKIVDFHIEPGVRFSEVNVVFPGANEVKAAELKERLENQKLNLDIYENPRKVANSLERYLRERGYLQANVQLPQPRLNPDTGTGEVAIPVEEGPRYTIGNLEFSGNHAFSSDQLWSLIPVSEGSNYNPKSIQDSLDTLESYYHKHGYNEAVVTFQMTEDSKTAHANLSFAVNENRQSIIRDIAIEGNSQTSDQFIRRQLTFQTGDVLDFDKISETRKALYDNGIYTLVDFESKDMGTTPVSSQAKDVRVTVKVSEVRPYRILYGGYYDTDRGPGGILDIADRNFWGQAAALGTRFRYDSDLKEARLYYSQPFIRSLHLKTDASIFAQRETRPGFLSNRLGLSLIQEKRLGQNWLFDYGYRYDHVRWNGDPPDPTLFVANVPVARLVGTFTRDKRDSILDATTGSFNSQAFEIGPRFLGSQVGFWRYFGQYFRFVPLDRSVGLSMKDDKGEPIRPRLVYAGAMRLGLSKGFGRQSIITPERFFAGGGTTMRGFQQDLLGPLVIQSNGSPRPLGGEAMLLINNEIRFPIFGIFQGVGFVDIGNVYTRVSDFSLANLRKSAGPGLRLRTKFVLLRFDYGLKLDRKPGESVGEFFFSIGQAF